MITTVSQTANLQEALAQYEEVFFTARNLAPRTRREYAADLRDLPMEGLPYRHDVHAGVDLEGI